MKHKVNGCVAIIVMYVCGIFLMEFILLWNGWFDTNNIFVGNYGYL